MSEHGDELDIVGRPVRQVRNRMAVLTAVAFRGFLELRSDDRDGSVPIDTAEERFDLLAWLEPAITEATTWELEQLDTPAEMMAADDAIAATWSVEPLAALLAATSKLPAFQLSPLPANAREVMAVAPQPDQELSEFSLDIPPDEELGRIREVAELWFWRCHFETENRDRPDPFHRSLVAEVTAEAVGAGLLEQERTDDFEVGDKRFFQMTNKELERATAISSQRLWAMNWLCGFGNNWEEVPLDI